MRLDRTNTTWLGRWWWTIDRPALMALLILIAIGFVVVTAASPPVAQRLGYAPFYFVHRHHAFLAAGLVTMIVVSALPPVWIMRLAMIGLCVSIALMVLVPVIGIENKGAHRWIALGPMSLQPSEFMKPCFAIVTAWLLSLHHRQAHFPGMRWAVALYALVVALLIIQPDFGMTMVVSATWGIQIFLGGLAWWWIASLMGLGVGGMVAAYHLLPHVHKRIDGFLDPQSTDTYQIQKSLDAFYSGGILGRGPGEGQVKQFIPDSHTDFVFAVIGEEFGMIICIVVLSVFAFVVLRGFVRLWQQTDMFIILAVTGLLAQFGLQAMVNMGVSVNLLPAKGMTLPFLSYGGSSVVALALGMGMMLGLTRRQLNVKGRRR